MNMEKKSYRKFADAHAPRSPLWKDCVLAFLTGGAICTLGQLLKGIYEKACGLPEEDAGTLTSVSLIFLAVILTGLGLFDRIAKVAGAGTLPSRALPTPWSLPPLTAMRRAWCLVWARRSLRSRAPCCFTEPWRERSMV